jgi:hypothetical protein
MVGHHLAPSYVLLRMHCAAHRQLPGAGLQLFAPGQEDGPCTGKTLSYSSGGGPSPSFVPNGFNHCDLRYMKDFNPGPM